jgi:hypothetical protein
MLGAFVGAGVLVAAGGAAWAFEGPAPAAPNGGPRSAAVVPSRSPLEAFENARNAYQAGNKTAAVSSLQLAAGAGHAGAQWMLGRMYAEGDGVGHDDFKAFEYFREVVRRASSSEFADSLEGRDGPYISSALVWLGSYYLEGIPAPT